MESQLKLMKAMKLIWISQYFPPEATAAANRAFQMGKKLVELGFDITVVTCFPNHPGGSVYKGYKKKLYSKEIIEGINVIRLGTLTFPNKGIALRSIAYFSYMVASGIALIFLKGFDCCYISSPPITTVLGTFPIAKLKRMKIALEIRDLWPASIREVGAIKNKFILALLERIELLLYKYADFIVTVTSGMKNDMVERGVPPGKIEVITNGFDFDDIKSPSITECERIRKELILEGKFVVSYMGTLAMAHGLELLFQAAYLLKDDDDVHFLIVGDGAEREKLEETRDDLELTNLTMVGLIPREDIPCYLYVTDVSVIILKDTKLFKTALPSKLFDSWGSGVPVIAAVGGLIDDVVRAAGGGIITLPGNLESLVEGIKEAKHKGKQEMKNAGENGREYCMKNFSRSKLGIRLAGQLSKFKS